MSTESINNNYQWKFTDYFKNFNPFRELNETIGKIANKEITAKLSDAEAAELKYAFTLSSFSIVSFFGLKDELQKITKSKFEELLKVTHISDVENLVNSYLECLDDEALMKMIDLQVDHELITNISLGALRAKKNSTKSFFDKEIDAIYGEFKDEIINFMYRICDILISITGIKIFLQDVPDNFDVNSAKNRIELYISLLASPKILLEFFSLWVEKKAAFALTAVSLITVFTSILIYTRYFKRCPSKCLGLNNAKNNNENNLPVYSREDINFQIENAFSSGKGVLLVGGAGVGKTTLVNSFFNGVRKKKYCEQFIKNPEIFNTTVGILTTNKNSLKHIDNVFQNYSDQLVLFFDEFSSVFDKKNIDFANNMKTFADKHKYIIGAMTQVEYDNLEDSQKGEGSTFGGRRFKVIQLLPLDGEKLVNILTKYLQKKNPEIEFDKETLQHIVDIGAKKYNPETSLVDASISLLRQAIGKTKHLSLENEKKTLASLKDRHGQLKIQLSQTKKLTQEEKETLINDFEVVEKDIMDCEKTIQEKKTKFEALNKIERFYNNFKRRSDQIALKIDLSRNTEDVKIDPKLKRQWLKNELLVRLTAEVVGRKREELGLPSFSKDLINTILPESK